MHRPDQRTLEALFAHPLRHGVRASEVESLCRALGAEVEASSGRMHIRMPAGSETWIATGPGSQSAELDAEALRRLRHLLQEAGVTPLHPQADPPQAHGDRSVRLVLHLSHQATEAFRLEPGPAGDGVEASVLRPHGLWGSGENLSHRHDRDLAGQRAPLDHEYLGRLLAAIAAADAVLLLGHGTGSADLRQALLEEIQVHRPDLLPRIVGVETVQAGGLGPDGLLAIARRYFGNLPARHLPLVPGQESGAA